MTHHIDSEWKLSPLGDSIQPGRGVIRVNSAGVGYRAQRHSFSKLKRRPKICGKGRNDFNSLLEPGLGAREDGWVVCVG